MTKKGWTLLFVLALTCGLASFSMNATADSDNVSDEVKIAKLTQELESMTPDRLNSLEPIPIRRYEVPGAGVDVMRARLRETYTIDGIGTDTVELTGWISVKHDNARPAQGEIELNWNTAVVDTEFLAMDVSGYSEVFGPVQVTLDRSRPSRGQVGRIEIPELARAALLARLDTSERDAKEKGVEGRRPVGKASKAAPKPAPKAAPKADTRTPSDADQQPTATQEEIDATAVCAAPVVASVTMPDLGLSMKTKSHVFWYSLVDTIPPVGHTASIAIDPVRLISAGREVGTLESGVVTFREVVRHVQLSDGNQKFAANQ